MPAALRSCVLADWPAKKTASGRTLAAAGVGRMTSPPVCADVNNAREHRAAMEQSTAVLRTIFIFSSSGCDASIQGGAAGGADGTGGDGDSESNVAVLVRAGRPLVSKLD